MSERFGLQVSQEELPAHTLIEKKTKPGKQSSRAKDDSCLKALHSRLQLFSSLLEMTLPDILCRPVLGTQSKSVTALDKILVRSIRDDDVLRCVRRPANDCSQKKDFSYHQDKEQHFGGSDLVWMKGAPRSWGETARMLISVFPNDEDAFNWPPFYYEKETSYTYNKGFSFRNSIALPTKLSQVKGIPPALPILEILESDFGSQLANFATAALKQYTKFARDSNHSTLIQESVLGPATRETPWRKITKRDQMRIAAGLVAASLTGFMQEKLGDGNFPLTSPLSADSHNQFLAAGQCQQSELPDPPSNLEEVIAHITESYKTEGAFERSDPGAPISRSRSFLWLNRLGSKLPHHSAGHSDQSSSGH